MKSNMMRCPRCDGRKKMFKMNGGYSHANCGGPEVDCPMCLGKGECETPEAVMERGKKAIEEKEKVTTYTHTDKHVPHNKKKSKQIDIEDCIEEC